MKVTKEILENLKKLRRAMLSEAGAELHNPTPVAIPIGMERPPTLKEQIQRVLRTELSQQAHEQGEETFEEANDFDVPDEDPEPVSPYPVQEMVEEVPASDPEADPADPQPDPLPDPEKAPQEPVTE